MHIGQPLSMDATVSAHVAQKRRSCLLIVSNINGSPYSQAVLHFLVLHFQRPPPLYDNLPNYQLNWLQQIQNSLVRAVVKAPKSLMSLPFSDLSTVVVNECIEYKLPSLTYKVLTSIHPKYFTTRSLVNLLAVPAPHPLSSFRVHADVLNFY